MAFAATIGRRCSHSPAPGFGGTSAQEAGARQKLVCATMRWSGRTDWPSMCQARLRTSIVSTMPKPLPSSSLRSCTTCVTCGVYATSTPPRCMARAACLATAPRLGQVEHHPVEIGFVDALVGVADLDLVVRQRILTQERGHVALGPAGEVLPQLVTGHHRRPAPASSTTRRPDPRLEHAGAGEDVGEHEDRAQVLG